MVPAMGFVVYFDITVSETESVAGKTALARSIHSSCESILFTS